MASRRKAGAKKKIDVGGDNTIHVTITQSDMDKEMQKAAIDVAKKSFTSATIEKDLAQGIKKGFEELYPETTWHCISGTHFGVSISYATKHLCFMQVNNQRVLLFKSIDF